MLPTAKLSSLFDLDEGYCVKKSALTNIACTPNALGDKGCSDKQRCLGFASTSKTCTKFTECNVIKLTLGPDKSELSEICDKSAKIPDVGCKTDEDCSSHNSTTTQGICENDQPKKSEAICGPFEKDAGTPINPAEAGTATNVGSTGPPQPSAPANPVTPNLNVDIPGLEFTPTEREKGKLVVNFVNEYFSGVFNFAIGFLALMSVLILAFAGVRWVTAAGDAAKIGEAKKMISGTVLGLLIAIGSFTLLALIDERLIDPDALEIAEILPEGYEFDDDLPEEYAELADALAKAEYTGQPVSQQAIDNANIPAGAGAALQGVPPAAGNLAQKKFYDKCGDPATLISIANKFLAQPVCQGPCHCAPTVKRWLIQSGCNPADLKGAGLVKTMKKLMPLMKHPDGRPMYILRTGDDQAHISPGDVVFIKNGHVGMYYGDGYSVDSGTGRPNAKIRTACGCPQKIWDSYGTDKCAACSPIPRHTPKEWLWARGQLVKDLKSGNVTNNICYKIWHNTLSLIERNEYASKATTAMNKKNVSLKSKGRWEVIIDKLGSSATMLKREKEALLNLAPGYCTSCVGNQCVAKNKWKGKKPGKRYPYGYDTYADYQP